MIKRTLAAAIILLAASCKKENMPVSTKEILSKVAITDPATNTTGTARYLYNSQGQLTEIVGGNNKNTDTTRQLFTYNPSGYLISYLVTNNTSGDQYKYDYNTDASGRVLGCTATALVPGMYVNDIRFVYDASGRITSDSLYMPTGELYSYAVLEYGDNDNVASFQQFIINGTDIYTPGKFTYQYDNKRSPFNKIGLLLYTVSAGGDSYFYLSKNNTTAAFKDGTVITPGGHFTYTYYNNDILHTSKVNVSNSLLQEFFYE